MVLLGTLWGNTERPSVFHIVSYSFSGPLWGNTENLSVFHIVRYGFSGPPLGECGKAFRIPYCLPCFFCAPLGEYGKALRHCLLWFAWAPSGRIRRGFLYFTLFAMVFLDTLSVLHIVCYGFSEPSQGECGQAFRILYH